jgi:hypothetical protein
MIEIKINKRELMVFDDIEQANGFIDSFTLDFADNILFSSNKDEHLSHIESSIIFYNPHQSKPEGQEVVLLDIKMPKG